MVWKTKKHPSNRSSTSENALCHKRGKRRMAKLIQADRKAIVSHLSAGIWCSLKLNSRRLEKHHLVYGSVWTCSLRLWSIDSIREHEVFSNNWRHLLKWGYIWQFAFICIYKLGSSFSYVLFWTKVWSCATLLLKTSSGTKPLPTMECI